MTLAHLLWVLCRGNPMWLPWRRAATQGRPYKNNHNMECMNLLWSDLAESAKGNSARLVVRSGDGELACYLSIQER